MRCARACWASVTCLPLDACARVQSRMGCRRGEGAGRVHLRAPAWSRVRLHLRVRAMACRSCVKPRLFGNSVPGHTTWVSCAAEHETHAACWRAERRTPVEGKESVRCGTKGGTIREEGAAELSSQHCDSEVAGSVVWTPQASGARATIWPGCDAVAPTRPNATRWATPPWWRLTPLSPARAPPARTYTFCQ